MEKKSFSYLIYHESLKSRKRKMKDNDNYLKLCILKILN